MISHSNRISAVLSMSGAALALWATAGLAQAPHPVAFVPGGTISLAGDSTLHKYTCTSRAWRITATAIGDKLESTKVASLEVTVPVGSLKSGDGKLDANMVRALKGDKFPDIRFVASRFMFKAQGGETFGVSAAGRLQVAGVERPATVLGVATQTGHVIHVVGSYSLLMSEFGVQPPVLLGGLIKVADPIAVSFDLTATLAPDPAL